jgi:thymidylate synthase
VKFIESSTADEMWLSAASEFKTSGNYSIQEGRGGETREIVHVAFTLREPRQHWVVSRQPPLNPAFALAEVVWILCGRNDSAFLNYWNSQLPQFAGLGDTYHGAYGYRLRRHFGLDQLERAYLALRHDPDTRQAVLQIWDPRIDLPDEGGRAASEDIPCNVTSLLKVREGKLEWMQIMRSNDLFRGLPYNLIQFTSIQEVLAGWLEIELGTYNHLSDSLHVYQRDYDYLATPSKVEVARNTDNLAVCKAKSDQYFSELNQRIECLMSTALTKQELLRLTTLDLLPQAFQNMLLILAAEVARRKGWQDLEHKVGNDCTNPALVQAWNNWLTRFGRSAA